MFDPLMQSNEQILEMQNDRFKKQLLLVAERSPWYKKFFRENKVRVPKIKTLDDLVHILPTTKKDYVTNPESFRLVHKEKDILNTVWQILYSAGTTTGWPSPYYWTTYDYYCSLIQAKRTAKIDGLCSKDVVINLCPLTLVPHSAFHRSLDSCAVTGAVVASALTGSRLPGLPVHNSADYAVSLIEERRATVLMGMPSFIRRLLLQAVREGRDYSSIRLIRVFGEPCHDGLRENIHDLLVKLGAFDTFIANCFGSTESSGALAIECREGCGMHVGSPDYYYLEILNPSTYERVSEGETGLLCLTHLDKRGTVLVRFLIGDMVSVSTEKCPLCGRNGMRIISQPYRTSEIVKIKSTTINPDALKAVLTGTSWIEEYRIIYTKEDINDPYSLDKLKIQVSVKADSGNEVSVEGLAEKIRQTVEITPYVEVVEGTEIYDPQKSPKAVRIVDERPRLNEYK